MSSPGDLVLVAFSGGPDSCALLWGLSQIAPRLGLRLHAAHFDHGLDACSAERAAAAQGLARQAEVPFSGARAMAGEDPKLAGLSPEANARYQRYDFLHALADRLGARFITTAHHADDQAETVVLRMLFGSGWPGLAAILPVRGRLLRPLLGVRRSALAAVARACPLQPLIDPTNADQQVPRNRVRLSLLPHLRQTSPDIDQRLCQLATAAGRARGHLDRLLQARLRPRVTGTSTALEIDRHRLTELPQELRQLALALLHRQAGAAYPAPSSARHELYRQLALGHSVGCDCGDGWRWDGDSEHLWLHRQRPAAGAFTYNLQVPGSVDVPEAGLRFRLEPATSSPWMYREQPRRTGLRVALQPGEPVEIRNRRPGDRLRVLGSTGHRRLKEVLIDRRIPRFERDRLPLLWIRGELAWVPGVTIGDTFRLPAAAASGAGDDIWIASIERI